MGGSKTHGSAPGPMSSGPPGLLLPVLLVGVLLAVLGGNRAWFILGRGEPSPGPTPSYGSTSQPSSGKSPSPALSSYPVTTTTSTTLGPAPSPSPTTNEQLDQEALRAYDALNEGRLAYNPETEMIQGVSSDVIARVGSGPNPPGLADGFKESPRIVALKVSGEMEARLTGDPDAFKIVGDEKSQTRSLLEPLEEWTWQVTPLKSGQHTLRLIVAVNLKLSDRSTRQKFITKEASIHVTVNRPYVALGLVREYGPWVITGISPLVIWGWIASRRRQKREEAERRQKEEEEKRKEAAKQPIGYTTEASTKRAAPVDKKPKDPTR
jgi:hypothetical protein